MKASSLTIRVPPFSRSRRLVFRAAGFMATSTLGASPGVTMSREAKWIWKADTPASVPAGARISAGKSGSVTRSLPSTAVALVNRSPVSCIPSPESPANRTTTRSFSTTVLGINPSPCRASPPGPSGNASTVPRDLSEPRRDHRAARRRGTASPNRSDEPGKVLGNHGREGIPARDLPTIRGGRGGHPGTRAGPELAGRGRSGLRRGPRGPHRRPAGGRAGLLLRRPAPVAGHLPSPGRGRRWSGRPYAGPLVRQQLVLPGARDRGRGHPALAGPGPHAGRRRPAPTEDGHASLALPAFPRGALRRRPQLADARPDPGGPSTRRPGPGRAGLPADPPPG